MAQIMQPSLPMLRKIGFSLFIMALTAAARSEAQTNRLLSLRDCIQLALQHNYDVQIERLTPEIARYRLQASYGVYEPSFNANAGQRFVNQPATFDPKKSGIDSPYELTTDTLGLGIQGLLPTGLTYDTGGSANYLNAKTDFALSPKDAVLFPPNGIRDTNQYFSVAAVTLRQPLLRDFWIDADRQRIWVDKKNLKISTMTLRWKIMNTIYAVEQTYYELLFAREKVKVEQSALELANQLLAETRKRVEVGDLPPLDEKQAEAQAQLVQTDLYAAQQTVAEQQNALKNLVTDQFADWADVTLEPGEALLAIPQIFDRSESWRAATSTRPDLVELRLELEKQGILVRYRYNQMFPKLDLVGGYGLQGWDSSLGATLANIRDRNSPIYSYGVEVNIPLGGNRTARHNYQASQAVRQQAALRLKKIEQDALVQVDDVRGRAPKRALADAPGAPLCRGSARGRTEKAAGRRQHALRRAPTAAKADRRAHGRNPRLGRLQ